MVAAAPARIPTGRLAPAATEAHGAGRWTITQTDRAAHRIDVPTRLAADWEQWVLLTSDWHLDSPHCDRRYLSRVLDLAAKRDAIHIVVGDALDLMQGKYDPRSNKADLRPEYIGKPYLSAVADDFASFVGGRAAQIALITRGNHEQSVSRRVEWDVADNLSARLRADHGAPTLTGAYAGYVRLVFTSATGKARSIVIAYDHGSGGGGPVTRGVIGTNRRSVYLPDADWIVTGHVHERWHVETTQERLSRVGKVTLRPQHHLCLGGFKEERLIGSEFHVERGRGPKPLGGYWARITSDNSAAADNALRVEFIMTT